MSELPHVITHFDLPSSPHSVADFPQAKCDFTGKRPFCGFEQIFEGLGATYDIHLMLIGKHFLLVLIELFLLRVTTEALRAKID